MKKVNFITHIIISSFITLTINFLYSNSSYAEEAEEKTVIEDEKNNTDNLDYESSQELSEDTFAKDTVYSLSEQKN